MNFSNIQQFLTEIFSSIFEDKCYWINFDNTNSRPSQKPNGPKHAGEKGSAKKPKVDNKLFKKIIMVVQSQ